MTPEEEIRERDAKEDNRRHQDYYDAWQDRRWLLRELDRVKKDLVICRKSKSVYDYSDKMSERVNAEANHLLKEQVKRLEEQLAEAQKDTDRLDWKPRSPISINYDPDVDWWLIEDGEGELGAGQALRQALDNARGKE